MKYKMKPRWTHDCDNCKYLGSVDHARGRADWYECGESVIARFGNEGANYWSILKGILHDDRYVETAIREMTAIARFMLSPKISLTQCGMQSCGAEYWEIEGQATSCPSCGMR